MADLANLPLYFDHNASTPVLAEVLEAMLPYFSEHFGNPSSQHAYGRAAKRAVDAAREEIAKSIDAKADEILFTSGGTESNNLAILGAAAAKPYRHHVVTSSIEHPAIDCPLGHLERDRGKVTFLPVDSLGRVRTADAERAVNDGTLLVTVMHSNNETGAVQPILELARIAHRAGALCHSDASQSLGKLPVSVAALGVDLLTIAGHKLYAPKGVGALYIREGTMIAPLMYGASHERGLRPGTENVANIVGLGRACAIAQRDAVAERARLTALSERLFERLRGEVPGLALNGPPLSDPERLPNTLSVRFPGVSGRAVLDATPEVAASTGSACHGGEEQASRGIVALGLDEAHALETVRISIGRMTDEASVDRAAAALARGYERVSRAAPPRAPRGPSA